MIFDVHNDIAEKVTELLEKNGIVFNSYENSLRMFFAEEAEFRVNMYCDINDIPKDVENLICEECSEQIADDFFESNYVFDYINMDAIVSDNVENTDAYEKYIKSARSKLEIINDDVEVIYLAEQDQYFVRDGYYANLNKNSTLKMYIEDVKKGDYHLVDTKITREIHFSDIEILKLFENCLLEDFDFIKGTGGSGTDDPRICTEEDILKMTPAERKTVKFYNYGIAVYLDKELQFVIDAEGYSYARYVGLVGELTKISAA